MWTSPSALLLPLVMAWITTSVTRVLARFVPPPPAAAIAHSKHFVYANGNSEADLPPCTNHAVCNCIENYFGSPKIHHHCRCPTVKAKLLDGLPAVSIPQTCSTTLDNQDGHTITDDSQLYKVCSSVDVFPTCRYFHDTAYTITTYPAQNRTQQIIRCVCPSDSTTYMLRWKQKHYAPNHKMTYHYACSPQTFLRCGKEEPCSLFVDSGSTVNKQAVCSCAQGSTCPSRVTEPTVKVLAVDANLGATTYAAFCRRGL